MSEEGEDRTLAEIHDHNRPPTTPVAVRLPEPLLAEIDTIWHEREYDSRSEFIRAVLAAVAENPGVVDGTGGNESPLVD